MNTVSPCRQAHPTGLLSIELKPQWCQAYDVQVFTSTMGMHDLINGPDAYISSSLMNAGQVLVIFASVSPLFHSSKADQTTTDTTRQLCLLIGTLFFR